MPIIFFAGAVTRTSGNGRGDFLAGAGPSPMKTTAGPVYVTRRGGAANTGMVLVAGNLMVVVILSLVNGGGGLALRRIYTSGCVAAR
jgi:hypothetical protein